VKPTIIKVKKGSKQDKRLEAMGIEYSVWDESKKYIWLTFADTATAALVIATIY